MKAIEHFNWLKSVIGDCGFVSDQFPEHECTKQNEREKDVFDGENEYLCIIADIRFPREFRMSVMKPYVYKEEKRTYFGWVGVDSDEVLSFWKNPIHELDDEFVVAWKALNK